VPNLQPSSRLSSGCFPKFLSSFHTLLASPSPKGCLGFCIFSIFSFCTCHTRRVVSPLPPSFCPCVGIDPWARCDLLGLTPREHSMFVLPPCTHDPPRDHFHLPFVVYNTLPYSSQVNDLSPASIQEIRD